jgi:hypothetical protein
MHCHVGIENREIGLQIIRLAIFCHIFLLSTNFHFGKADKQGEVARNAQRHRQLSSRMNNLNEAQ